LSFRFFMKKLRDVSKKAREEKMGSAFKNLIKTSILNPSIRKIQYLSCPAFLYICDAHF